MLIFGYTVFIDSSSIQEVKEKEALFTIVDLIAANSNI